MTPHHALAGARRLAPVALSFVALIARAGGPAPTAAPAPPRAHVRSSAHPKAPASKAAPAKPATAAKGAPKPTDVVMTVNGTKVTWGQYRKILADAQPTWDILTKTYGKESLVTDKYTPQEYLFVAEYVEPLVVKKMYLDQVKSHLAQANECYHRALAGEDWSKLCKKYSTEPGAVIRDGDMGAMRFRQLPAPFNRVMFSAPLGKVQPPVLTMFGYHVGKVTEITEARDVPAMDGSGKTVHQVEHRRVSSITIIWDAGKNDEGTGNNLRLIVARAPQYVDISGVDDRVCSELPHICAHHGFGEPEGLAPPSPDTIKNPAQPAGGTNASAPAPPPAAPPTPAPAATGP